MPLLASEKRLFSVLHWESSLMSIQLLRHLLIYPASYVCHCKYTCTCSSIRHQAVMHMFDNFVTKLTPPLFIELTGPSQQNERNRLQHGSQATVEKLNPMYIPRFTLETNEYNRTYYQNKIIPVYCTIISRIGKRWLRI